MLSHAAPRTGKAIRSDQPFEIQSQAFPNLLEFQRGNLGFKMGQNKAVVLDYVT